MLNKKYFFLLLLLFLTLIPLFDLLHPGLPATHDGQDHVARIANFYINLESGNIVPRWAPNLNWGYGHPILMFLYPLPSYMASFFHFLQFSLVDSVKITFGLAFIFSGLAMYAWIRSFLDEKAALVAGLLYTLAPYRFIDLYVRGAIGEHVAFIFPPLILYCMHNLSKKYSYKYVFFGSLAFAGLILSHNAISLMFLPIFFLYGLFLLKTVKVKRKFIVNAFLIFLTGLSISAFFWMPAFFEGKYTLRDIVTAGTYKDSFVDFSNFLYGPWKYGGTKVFSVQVGILQWLFVIVSIGILYKLRRAKNNLWVLLAGLLSIFAVTLFLMTSYSDFVWQIITILQKFQFPWRFLSIVVFATAAIGGIVTFCLPKKVRGVVVLIIVVALLFLNKDYWHARDFIAKDENFYTDIYKGSTDTGESAPIWSVRFMEKEAVAQIEVIEGNAIVKPIERKATRHSYEIETTQSARIRENTLYFRDWIVKVDGKPTLIEYQDPANRGLITFFLTPGKHVVTLDFEETKLRLLSDIISIAGILFLVLIWKIFR